MALGRCLCPFGHAFALSSTVADARLERTSPSTDGTQKALHWTQTASKSHSDSSTQAEGKIIITEFLRSAHQTQQHPQVPAFCRAEFPPVHSL